MKAAIVTGAAKGIGRACVRRLVADGYGVVAVDRDKAGLAGLVEDEARVVALVADVTRPEANREAVAAAVEAFGQLDTAIANAGVTLAKSIDDTTDADLDRLLAVNVRAIVHLAKASHDQLGETEGSFIVVASKTGLVAQPDSPAYVATKGAAVQLARALALDWAPQQIRVNAVCPGIVDTPMLEEFLEGMPDPEEARRAFATAQPLGRLATPQECAAAVAFLASDDATFITGIALPVDGGFTAQ